MKGAAKAVTDVMFFFFFSKFELLNYLPGLHLRNVVLSLGQCTSVR
jgi:hypothetical protein